MKITALKEHKCHLFVFKRNDAIKLPKLTILNFPLSSGPPCSSCRVACTNAHGVMINGTPTFSSNYFDVNVPPGHVFFFSFWSVALSYSKAG